MIFKPRNKTVVATKQSGLEMRQSGLQFASIQLNTQVKQQTKAEREGYHHPLEWLLLYQKRK